MLKNLRTWLQRHSGNDRQRPLRLPAGVIVAEQGLQHRSEAGGGRSVTALLHEAYVVMRLDNRSSWYATWQPRLGDWELLHLDEEPQAAPQPAPRPLPRLASAQ